MADVPNYKYKHIMSSICNNIFLLKWQLILYNIIIIYKAINTNIINKNIGWTV